MKKRLVEMTAKIENLLKITAKLGNSLKSAFKARHFAALFVIYLVAVYPIIRSNFNYIDDMGRVFAGFAGWGYFSRFTSNCLSRFIHTAEYLFDISPLAQVLAICILCVSGLCAISIIKRGEKTTYWDLIAILPLGLSPYFLECISYKFDSPYMALSILSSIAPLLFYRSNKIIYCAAVLVGMLVMCTTYQAASGIFPMLVMLVSFMMWISKDEYKEIIAFVSASAISYLIGIAIFNLFIMRPVDTYVSNGIASFSEIIEHYKTYLKLVKSDFRKTWQLVALALTVLFVLVNTYKSKQNKFISFLVALAVAAIMFMLSFGLYPILKRPLTAPRAMYGVGAYIAFVSVGGMYSGYSRYASRFLTCVMAWLFIVFSCAYGNALALQKEYENFRITEAIYSLSQLEQFNIEQPKEIELVGSVGHAPAIQNAIRRSAMLRRLVPVMFSPWPPWGYYKFMNYYGLRNVKYAKEAYKGSYEDLALLHESHYHKIYLQDDNKFIIRL